MGSSPAAHHPAGGRSGRSISLQWQITAAVALGLVTLLGAFGAIAYLTINESTKAALNERKAIAALSAEAVDHLVNHVGRQLQQVAKLPELHSRSSSEIENTLTDAQASMSTAELLVLVDMERKAVWSTDGQASSDLQRWLQSDEVAFVAEFHEPRIFQVQVGTSAEECPPLAIVAVPLVGSQPGTFLPVLLADIHLKVDSPGLVAFPQFGETSGTTIIDDGGSIISSTNGAALGETLEHFDLLAEFQETGISGVALHHPSDGKSHVVAFAPFETISGGVIVEEREDLVLAIPRQLRGNLLLFGLLGLSFASVFAWIHAWRTMRPVKELTGATRAISAGVLDKPIRVHRNDEIGQLAKSFDSMRQKLLAADRERLGWEQEMERRVKSRTEQVQTLLSRVISAQEEERKRVARDLHDVVAQDVATALLELQQLEQGPGDRIMMSQARDRLANTLKEMRRLISALRPSALDDLGLEAAIRDYAESRSAAQEITVSFESSGNAAGIDGTVQTALFRIVQEAVNNTVRHSRASNLQIRLKFGPDAIEASVCDDGIGFDMSKLNNDVSAEPRLGLEGIRERAAILSGEVEIESGIGRGTRVTVWIPLGE